MIATLLTIGDELLIGQVVNTNVAWLGEQLSALGVTVRRTAVVGDEVAPLGAGDSEGDGAGDDRVPVVGGHGLPSWQRPGATVLYSVKVVECRRSPGLTSPRSLSVNVPLVKPKETIHAHP